MGDLQYLFQMLLWVNSAGWIGWIVDDNGASAVVDLCFQILQIDQCSVLHVQFVETVLQTFSWCFSRRWWQIIKSSSFLFMNAYLNVMWTHQCGVQWESWLWHQNIVSWIGKRFDRQLQCLRTTARQDHVVSCSWCTTRSYMTGNGFPCLQSTNTR